MVDRRPAEMDNFANLTIWKEEKIRTSEQPGQSYRDSCSSTFAFLKLTISPRFHLSDGLDKPGMVNTMEQLEDQCKVAFSGILLGSAET